MDVKALRTLLIQHEGLRLKPYKCPADKWTIGVGRNLEDNGISHDEAMILLTNDISRVLTELDSVLPWWRQLDEVRQMALCDLAFNLGISKLLKFKNTLAALERQDYRAAADGLENSLWYKQVGKRAQKIVSMVLVGDGGPQS